MYPISQTALNKFQSGAMQYARITIGNTTITNANIVQGGMSINRYCSTGESVTVGSCVAAELSLTLANRDGSWNSFSFDGKEAYVEVGVYTSISTITYIPMGYFVIDEVKFDRNTVTLTALDRLVLFDGAIDATQFTFPYTLKTLLARLCAICGVTLGTTGNFTNYSYSVSALPSEAKTYRDVLRWICELSGTNGYIKYDGKLYIEWYSTSSGFTVTTANRTQSEVDENTFSLTGVTLIQDETRYSAGTSVRPIIIQDNPLVSNNPQTLVNNLNTKLNGFSWCPFNAVTLPAPHLYPMDRCTFTKKDGTNVAVSITGVTYKLNGNTSIVGGGDAQHKGRSYGLQDATFYAANIAAGAITADKIAAGAISADKIAAGTITVGNMSADAQSEMLNSNIEVGGRNLALRTATMPISGTPRWVMSVAGTLSTVALSDAPISGLTNAIRVTNETSSAARCGFCGSNTAGFVVGKQYTIGCWIRASVAGLTINLRAVWKSDSYTDVSSDNTTTTDWQYVKFEGATLTGTQAALYAPALIHVVSLPSNGWFEVCGIKLEEGNKASAWSPAPEDAEAYADDTFATKAAASSSSQRIYYRKSATGTPTAPSTWVTATATANESWTTKRMPYDATYKYLYTCVQTKTVSGAVSNSTVLLDDTTTVIDGGNIITGSVAANAISVTDLSAFNATVGGWTIDSSQILKEVTIDGYVYQVCLNAPASPVAGNWAIGVRRRATNSQSWSYLSYFNYSGKLYSQNAEITGKITASEGSIGDWTIGSDGLSADVTIADPESPSTDVEYHVKLAPAENVFEASTGTGNAARATIAADGVYTNTGVAQRMAVTIGGVTKPAWQQSVGSLSMANVSIERKVRLISGSDGEYHTYRKSALTKEYLKIYGERATFESDPTVNLEVSVDDTTNTSKFTNSDITFNGDSLKRLTPKLTQSFSTAIPANANLNTVEYLSVGQYNTASSSTAATQSNCPTARAYNMKVENTHSNTYDNESTATYVYRLRTITDIDGKIFVQSVYSGSTAGTFTFGTWKQIAVTSDITDTNVTQTATTTSAAYPLLFGASSFTQNTQVTTKTEGARISGGIFVNPNTATINARRIHSGTTSQYGRFVLGNAIANGTAGCSHGEMYIYGKGDKYVRIYDKDGVLTANREYYFPNQSGYLMVDAVTTGTPTSTSNVSYDSVTWTKVGKTVRLSGTFYFATSTSAGTLFTGLPTPASEMTIIVAAHDNVDWGIETLKINTSGEIVFGGVGTHLVDTGIQFVFDTTYIAASL